MDRHLGNRVWYVLRRAGIAFLSRSISILVKILASVLMSERGLQFFSIFLSPFQLRKGMDRGTAYLGGPSDYHENMNTKIFEDYTEKLCRHCMDVSYKEVVFCMGNAKYHRREFIRSAGEETRKTLSTLNKSELIQRVLGINKDLYVDDLKKRKKADLYDVRDGLTT
ncbi:hypothetical protein EDD21DRAFT_172704 [Dissophora ornata]|nr:hypothetical protein EDD21DRAFT_172704 [Dissophora ornata]